MRNLILIFAFLMAAPTFANTYKFPSNFQWCVATSGHQIEGDNIHSDWWAFEQESGRIHNNDRSGKASFHIERMEEDVEIMADLHVDTYRFSVEWSRIEPVQGQFNMEAVAHYQKELDLLKKKGIQPMVTLHHFVQPQWFTESGGWKRDDSPQLFFNFVQFVEKYFGAQVDYWVSFNEPMVLLIAGFGDGFFPPGEKRWELWTPMVNILKAHALTYKYFHQQASLRDQDIKMGIAHHIRPLIGKGWIAENLVHIPDFLLNWNIPTALKTGRLKGVQWKNILGLRIPYFTSIELPELIGTQDFYGLNYYTREVVRATFTPPFYARETLPDVPASELDWSIDPEGFYISIKKSHEIHPDLPIYITENGLADEKDQWRTFYVTSHLHQIHRAMTDLNVEIQGYCHWSLLDNFEWAEGFWPRFGLFEVDYANKGARKARPSVSVIREIFKTNILKFPLEVQAGQ